MAAEPTPPTDETPDRHPDLPDGGPVDDVELPDDDVVAGASDQAEDDEMDEVATEHALDDELPDQGAADRVDDPDVDYAALSPADEAGGVTSGDPDASAGSTQVGTGPGQGDPPSGTDQPVTADQVEVDDSLGSEDPADRMVDGDTIDGIDEPVGDDLDEAPDTLVEEGGVQELSADVRAMDDDRSRGAFDDSSSVVESDMTETGVSDAPSDGGDEHERDDALQDLPDDADGIESPNP